MRTKIIIIGAGIAGLSAAYTLQQSGLQDFKVLEAQSQPGGRINSLKFKSGYIELGAQWLHGSKSRLYKFIVKKGLLSSQVSFEGRGHYLRKGGERVSNELVSEIKGIVLNILNKCEEFYNKPGICSNFSVGEFLKREFENYLLSCHLDSPILTEVKRELFDWHLRFQIIDNSCHNLEDLSAVAWGRYRSCGDENLNLKLKYSQVVNTILKELPEDSIIYNKPVKLIEWDDNKQIKCYTPNNLYLADHIFVTSSVGFIKENHYNLFHPSLPTNYLKGFECLGFGTINKIFLYYKDPWWHDMEGIQLVWDSSVESFLNDKEDDLLWTRGVTGFDVLTQFPTVLLCWVGGKGAELMELLSDEVITIHCTILLNLFTGKQVPKPDDIVRSKWYSNEYTRGSYSYYNMANASTELTLTNQLLQPVLSVKNELQVPTIYFAGEALSKHHFSTVHGAFSSGLTQARKLIEYLQQ